MRVVCLVVSLLVLLAFNTDIVWIVVFVTSVILFVSLGLCFG